MKGIALAVTTVLCSALLSGCPQESGLHDKLFGFWVISKIIDGKNVRLQIEFKEDGTFYRSLIEDGQITGLDQGTWKTDVNTDPWQLDLMVTSGGMPNYPTPPYTIEAIYRMWDYPETIGVDILELGESDDIVSRPPSFVALAGTYQFQHVQGKELDMESILGAMGYQHH